MIAFAGMTIGGLYHSFDRYDRLPDIAQSYPDTIKAMLESRQFDEAAVQMRTALMIESGGSFPEAQLELSLGNAMASHDALPQAVHHFRQAVEIDPEFAKAHYALGVAIARQGNYHTAESHFQKARQLDENYAAPYYGLGKLYEARNETAASIEHFKKAVALFEKALPKQENQGSDLEPDKMAFAGAYNTLAVAAFSSGDFKTALAHIQKALAMNANYAEAHNNAGLIYLQLGEPDKALDHLETALRINPQFQQARLHLEATRRMLQQGPRGTER